MNTKQSGISRNRKGAVQSLQQAGSSTGGGLGQSFATNGSNRLDLPQLKQKRQVLKRGIQKDASLKSLNSNANQGGNHRQVGKARFGTRGIDSDAASYMTGQTGIPGTRQVSSINQIQSSYENIERLLNHSLAQVKEAIMQKKIGIEVSEELQSGPIEALALNRDILIHVAKKMGVILTFTLANEAVLVATKPRPVPKNAVQEEEKKDKAKMLKEKVQGDAKVLIKWFATNMSRLRPAGSEGNNFSLRKRSHGPMGESANLTGIGGLGERKFRGFSSSTAAKQPSRTQQLTMRILKPLQLAKQARKEHQNMELDSPSSPNPSIQINDEESPRRSQNPFFSQKDFLQSLLNKKVSPRDILNSSQQTAQSGQKLSKIKSPIQYSKKHSADESAQILATLTDQLHQASIDEYGEYEMPGLETGFTAIQQNKMTMLNFSSMQTLGQQTSAGLRSGSNWRVDSGDLSQGITKGLAHEMQSEAEHQLRYQIRDAIAMLKGDQKGVSAIRQQIAEVKADNFNQSAAVGIEGARKCRQRIRERKQAKLQEIEVFKNNLATANMSPMLVAKLSDLVTVGNTEIPNSYMIKSKLTDKDDARIKNILQYGSF